MTQDSVRPPTLRDVAAVAGVDRSLVSKVINEDPRLSIPDRTRQRVLDAVEELGYQPNLVARGLRTTQTYVLSFQLPELNNPVYAPIVAGAQRRAMEHGYVIALMDAVASPSREVAQSIRRFEGVLLASGTLSDDAVRAAVRPGIPTVVVNRRVEGVPSWVLVDDEAGSELATRYLLGLGHRRVAILDGPAGIDTSDRRLQGFDRAIATEETDAEVVHASGWNGTAGYDAGLRLLARRPDITAVFAATAMLGIGLLRAAHEHGRSVPEHLSVIALHDSDWLNFTVPPLTSVAMPMEALGAAAVDQLLSLARGENVSPTMVTAPPPDLVVRNSTAPPAHQPPA